MKNLITSLIIFIGTVLAFYLIVSFVELKTNPAEWSYSSRSIVGVFGGIFGIGAALIYYNRKSI